MSPAETESLPLEEREWLDRAKRVCGPDAGILMVRRQDNNDGSDLVVTNIKDPGILRYAARALNGWGTSDVSDNE